MGSIKKLLSCGIVIAMLLSSPAYAQTPGVTDTEIKLGQTVAYSGPASIAATLAKTQIAYIKMLNDNGGINGRKINLLSVDDGYSPPKTVEMTRKLVEQDEVLLIFGQMGTASALATRDYLNSLGIPQLMNSAGAAAFNMPKEYPWTLGTTLSYKGEAIQFGRYLASAMPNAKVGIIFQNDDFGKDYQHGVREGLGAAADKMIVSEQSFETTDPTIQSQLLSIKASGADVLVIGCVAKYAIMALKFLGEQNWHPQVMLTASSVSVSQVLEPAGKQNALNALTATPYKDPSDPRWQDDAEYIAYTSFMKKYARELNPNDQYALAGYITAQVMEKILRDAGNDLSRENIMKVASNMSEFRVNMLGPDVKISTTPDNYDLFKSLQLMTFNGTNWTIVDGKK